MKADDFNARYPVGVSVRFRRNGHRGPAVVTTVTTKPAVEIPGVGLDGPFSVVWLDGCVGWVPLADVEVVVT